MIYAGLDLHSNNVVIGLVDEEGRRLDHRRMDNRLDTILDWLKPHRDQLQAAAVEATYNWYWLVDGLRAAGYPVVLANPAGMKQYAGRKHTDDVSDAYFIAELLQLGILPTGHIYDPKLRPFRDMLRRRQSLVHQRTSLRLSLQSLYARTTGRKLPQGEAKALTVEDLPRMFAHPADQLVAGEQLRLMDHLEQSIHHLEAGVKAVAGQLPVYGPLTTFPGIGRILAMTISMETGPLARFASDGQYASYCRCVATDRVSNGKSKGENNGKCGNKYLAWAFVEAAHFARRADAACRRFYDRKQAKTNPMVATKALACKLAKAAWHAMKDNAPYDARRMFPFLRETPEGGPK
jgi:transposase